LGGGERYFFCGRDEPVAAPVNGLNVGGAAALVAQEAAGLGHRAGENGVAGVLHAPDLGEELLLADHSPAMDDQIDQQLQDPRLAFEGSPLVVQLEAGGGQDERAKAKDGVDPGGELVTHLLQTKKSPE